MAERRELNPEEMTPIGGNFLLREDLQTGFTPVKILTSVAFDPSEMESIIALRALRVDAETRFQELVRQGYSCYSVLVLTVARMDGAQEEEITYILAKKKTSKE